MVANDHLGTYRIAISPNSTATHNLTSWHKLEAVIKASEGSAGYVDLVEAASGHETGTAADFVNYCIQQGWLVIDKRSRSRQTPATAETYTLTEALSTVASLQASFRSENTEPMKARVSLIRQVIPSILEKHHEDFSAALGPYGTNLLIEGREGIGKKTQAPWIRIFNGELSPSATEGQYVVIHFSAEGTRCFITIGCGATAWDPDLGDWAILPNDELDRRISWILETLKDRNVDTKLFSDTLDLESNYAIPKSFERATALTKEFLISELVESEFISFLVESLKILCVIYEASEQRVLDDSI